jgi:hypothetical protein
MEQLELQGRFYLECFSPGGRKLWGLLADNAPVTVGLTDLLSVGFAGGTQKAAWFCGLIDNAGFTAISSGDTLASHAGWSELASYSGNRPQWAPLQASGALVANTTAMEFVFSAACTVRGLFICSVSSGTGGVLWAAARLSAARAFQAGQSLRATYTLRAAGGSG